MSPLPLPNTPRHSRPSAAARRRGFTLAEVIIAMSLSVVAMGGILSTSLMVTRAGYRVEQYTDMETESRKSLEQFGQDVRMAKDVTWHDANSLTLTIPLGATGTNVMTARYTYDPVARNLSRTTAAGTKVLLTGIDACTLMGFKANEVETHTSATPASSWATISASTKQIQLSVSSSRDQGNSVRTTQKVISARFIMRNKRA